MSFIFTVKNPAILHEPNFRLSSWDHIFCVHAARQCYFPPSSTTTAAYDKLVVTIATQLLKSSNVGMRCSLSVPLRIPRGKKNWGSDLKPHLNLCCRQEIRHLLFSFPAETWHCGSPSNPPKHMTRGFNRLESSAKTTRRSPAVCSESKRFVFETHRHHIHRFCARPSRVLTVSVSQTHVPV